MLSVDRRTDVDLLTREQAMPGRPVPLFRAGLHFVSGLPLDRLPAGAHVALFGMGCFWGAERKLWEIQGVLVTAAGYAGGVTPNPTYEEVCTGLTGHAEVVRVTFDAAVVSFEALLRAFWEGHDPTQGMRQGYDVGTQYRSAIYWSTAAQRLAATRSSERYGAALARAGKGPITTEILPLPEFYFAEDHHQQYLAKNPGGYCGLGGTGVRCNL